MDTTSRIQGFGQISISESASIDGRIEMLADGDSLTISMEPSASLSLHALGSISGTSLVVEGGKVSVMGHIVATRSIKAHCGRFIFDCAANASFIIDDGCDYSLYMSVEQLTVEGDGAIASAAMRLCVSSRVLMKDSGSITASSLGHQRGEGPGAGGVYSPTGVRTVTGAGSGGSHGGKGGKSGSYNNVAGMDGKEAYDEPMLPGYMGSGGGGSKGGQGGGIIHLHVGGQGLIMAQHSAIAADGVDAGNPQSRQTRFHAKGGQKGAKGDNEGDSDGEQGGLAPLIGFNCTAGYFGPLCQPCGMGFFKDMVGSQECAPCPNGTYASNLGSHNCTLCDAGMVSFSLKTECEYCPIGMRSCVALHELLLPPRYGGPALLLVPPLVALLLLLYALFVGTAAARRRASELIQVAKVGSRLRRRARAAAPTTPGIGDMTHTSVERCRGRKLTGSEPTTAPAGRISLDTALRLESPSSMETPSIESLAHALMYDKFKYRAKQHVLRVHLLGDNSAQSPWRLPPPTEALRQLVAEGSYRDISRLFDETAKWELWDPLMATILGLLPPLQTEFVAARRKRQWQRVCQLVSGLNAAERAEGVWRSMYSRVWESHRFELGCCAEHQHGWLDIFANISAPLAPFATRGTAARGAHDGASIRPAS
ncbi:protein serine threonine [Chrysochromulina tobinii]|uniref:Protein serine threonine n=1 Tax=Chrysochromulina tobinii TaxID=1460289 RepID=A0A0M0K0Z1_9EUKA|nr:protein serine threonine [Chrysochromulina tobinii]|eukprot:KOO32058.1 protein serine threonine [Chrysochromulina sp. CCMP291]